MEKQAFERPLIKKLTAGMPAKFGMKTEIPPISHIDDQGVEELAKQFGSPLFVLSEKTIRDTYSEAYRAFSTRYPKVQFAWSYKTNYLDAVCRVFHQEGSWAEVVSGFEFDKALSNGVPGKHIFFNGPEKSEEDLQKALASEACIHIDHFDELYSLSALSSSMKKKARVAIRVNMDVGIYPKWDRFGFNYENGEAWDALNRIMMGSSLELVGLHAHIGTYMMSTEAYRLATSKLADLAVGIERKYGHVVKYIDIGGGFASKNTLRGAYLPGTDTCPSFDEYAEAITSALLNSAIKPENLPMLVLETGRALIDDAGYLIATVLANKHLSSGYRSTVIDAGVNILFTSFWYDHQINPAQPTTQHTEETAVYGPLCMNIDVIRASMVFPLVKKGDRVVISRVGAYNMSQWMQFITFRPNVVMIGTDGKTYLVREKENLEVLRLQENIPEHLKNPHTK